jgi:hypothetical protein
MDHQRLEGRRPERRTGPGTGQRRDCPSIALVMAKYQERLAAYQSVDFDDLIALP